MLARKLILVLCLCVVDSSSNPQRHISFLPLRAAEPVPVPRDPAVLRRRERFLAARLTAISVAIENIRGIVIECGALERAELLSDLAGLERAVRRLCHAWVELRSNEPIRALAQALNALGRLHAHIVSVGLHERATRLGEKAARLKAARSVTHLEILLANESLARPFDDRVTRHASLAVPSN